MKLKFSIILTALMSFAVISPAYAYLDPGTGSLIIQGLIAAFTMATMAIRMYWQKLVEVSSSIFRKDSSEDDEPEEP